MQIWQVYTVDMQSIPAPLIGLLFIASGFSSLVYQTIWIRVLSLELGSTAFAMGFVLAIFFSGLAIGSFFASKFIERISNPFRFYAILELVIGVFAFLEIYILFQLPTYLWLKYLIAFFLLFVPTVAMGATWPVFIKAWMQANFLSPTDSISRSKISFFYGWNTFGAAIGALSAGFLLIPNVGILSTNHIAVGLNIFIFIAAIIINKKIMYQPMSKAKLMAEEKESIVEIFEDKSKVEEKKLMKFFYFSVLLLGFSSISLEIVWTKYLSLYFGTNIYGVSLIVGIFLLGVSFGSLVISSWIKKIIDREKNFLVILFFAILTTLATTTILNYIPLLSSIVAYFLGDYLSLFYIKILLASFVVLPPTALLGSLLPLSMAVGDKDQYSTKNIGNLYAINTCGAIIGALFSGALFIPVFGSSFVVKLSILLLSVIFICASYYSIKHPKKKSIYIFAASILSFLAIFFAEVDFRKLIQGAYYQYQPDQITYADIIYNYAAEAEDFDKIFEGNSSIISLSYKNNEDGGEPYLWLKTNGLNESYYSTDLLNSIPKYEGLLAFLPYALHSKVNKAFVVGYGGGYSVDLLSSLGIPSVEVAEIEPAILKAADYVAKGKNQILERPNVKIILEDARVVLNRKKNANYDILISQPSHSWQIGVANLFTKEFFELAKQSLSEGGIFSQWLNLYNTDIETLRSIFFTFYTVFPHGMVFTDIGDSEIILIGMKSPLKFNYKMLSKLAADVRIRQQLEQIPFNSPYDIFPQFLFTREEALKFSGNIIPMNTDRNAFAEIRQAKLFYANQENQSSEFLNELFEGNFEGIVDKKWENDDDFYFEVLYSILKKSNNFWKFHILFQKIEKNTQPRNKNALWFEKLGNLSYRMERYHSASKFLEESLRIQPRTSAVNQLIAAYTASEKYSEAKKVITKYKHLKNPYDLCLSLDLLLWQKKMNEAKQIVTLMDRQQAKDICGDSGDRLWGIFYLQLGDAEKAIPYLETYNDKYPNDIYIQEKLLAAYLLQGRRGLGDSLFDSLPVAIQNEAKRLEQMADFYQAQGLNEDARILQKKSSGLSLGLRHK